VLAFDQAGEGPPLILLHGTNTTRRLWAPLMPALAEHHEVLALDLPGNGDSAPTAMTPPAWAREVAAWMDAVGLGRAAVVGLSSGGWTALELAKLGRATGVLALAPAGLWARRSPLVTDVGLVVNWSLGQVVGTRTAPLMRSRLGRTVSLRQISARPAEVPADVAVATLEDAARSRHFPEHLRRTRLLRFTGGDAIAPDVPVRVVWGAEDRVARAGTSRHGDQLPAHAVVETWEGCGHVVPWDAPQRFLRAALALPAAVPVA
jgi:pimeloyl-ACP methyl ester carboxylesterase